MQIVADDVRKGFRNKITGRPDSDPDIGKESGTGLIMGIGFPELHWQSSHGELIPVSEN
jgi:hypothetical protein